MHELREEEIRIGSLSTPIRLRVYLCEEDGKLLIEQSHFLKTAIQYLPYAVKEFPGTDVTESVRRLENTLRGFYDQAVRRGYVPSETWLVPNSAFEDKPISGSEARGGDEHDNRITYKPQR